MNSELDTRRIEAAMQAAYAQEDAAHQQARPFVLLRPRMFPDGNQWCALYGDNLQEGVSGFGDTPALAASDFDKEWVTRKLGAPIAVQPLTDEQIENFIANRPDMSQAMHFDIIPLGAFVSFARAVEHAHGIGEKP